MRKRRIVLTYPYHLGVPGGSPLDWYQTALHLQSAGAEVILVTISTPEFSRFPRGHVVESPAGQQREESLREHGIQVLRVSRNPLHGFLDCLSVKKAVQNILDQQSVDVVLGCSHEATLLPALLRKRRVTFGMIAAASYSLLVNRSSQVGQLAKRLAHQAFYVRPLKQADIVFARSRHTRDELVNLLDIEANKIQVAYCGVQSVFTHIPRVCLGEISRLIYYGRLDPRKGVFDAIKALGQVAAMGIRNWTFKIIGAGDTNQVQNCAKEHGIRDRVIFIDHMDQKALSRELEWAQLAILPSYAESFGFANAEAQASGLPVIAYDVGAVPEVVEKNETGWLLPPGNVNELAKAMIEAFQQPRETFLRGVKGRERTARLFTWDQAAKGILEGLEAIR